MSELSAEDERLLQEMKEQTADAEKAYREKLLTMTKEELDKEAETLAGLSAKMGSSLPSVNEEE